MNFGRVLVAILAALFLFECVAWVTGIPHKPQEYSLVQEWKSGIGNLGVTPVFPPREDVQVGDLYLKMLRHDDAEATKPMNDQIQYWLGDLHLAAPIQNFYKERFAMPVEEASQKDPDGKEDADRRRQAALPTAPNGIFKVGDVPVRLRNVSFPNLAVASTRSTKLSVADSILQFINTGTLSEAGYNVTVGIPDAEGYAVPALNVIPLINKYCDDNFADNVRLLTEILAPTATESKEGSNDESKKESKKGAKIEWKIEVVTGVYYARSIDYTVSRRHAAGASATVEFAELDRVKRLVGELAQPNPANEKPRPAAEKEKSASVQGAGTATAPSGNSSSGDKREEEIVARIKDELDKMSAALERPNAPAVSGTIIRSDSQSVTLRRIFSQPIIIGYQSLPFAIDRFESLACNPPPPPQCIPPSHCPDPPAPPPPQQVYLVFFDWDRYDLTRYGEQIVEEAARQYHDGRSVKIQIAGYTDLSGSAGYNDRLSARRAFTVANTLASMGIDRNDMIVTGRGMNDPRVPTPPGVREPKNRRVEITK